MSLTRYNLDTSECEGDNASGSCHAKVREDKRGEYVLYDDVTDLFNDIRNGVVHELDDNKP